MLKHPEYFSTMFDRLHIDQHGIQMKTLLWQSMSAHSAIAETRVL